MSLLSGLGILSRNRPTSNCNGNLSRPIHPQVLRDKFSKLALVIHGLRVLQQLFSQERSNIECTQEQSTVEPHYKEVGYNETLL